MTDTPSQRVVFVTGAASGIGRACVRLLASQGYAVGAMDIDRSSLATLEAEICTQGGRILLLEGDVSIEGDVRRCLGEVKTHLGRLDCAANIAGIEGERSLLADATVSNLDRVLAVNVRGIFLAMKYEIPLMKEGGGGCIVNMSSGAGLGPFAEFAAYSASKHAVIGLTKSAAVEYARDNIRINAVCPGTIDTPMVERFMTQWPELQRSINARYPVGRIGKPEEIAEAVAWLCRGTCTFMTGTHMLIDGGISL